jgi:hypothetical protein
VIIDDAEQIGLRDAGAYLGKFGRYPTQDDEDNIATEAWKQTWEDLQRRGADDSLHEACFTAWNGGFRGNRA